MKKLAVLLFIFHSPCFAIEMVSKSTMKITPSEKSCNVPFFCDECHSTLYAVDALAFKEEIKDPTCIEEKNEENEQLVTKYIEKHGGQHIPDVLIQMCYYFSMKYRVCEHVDTHVKKQFRNGEDAILEIMAIYNLQQRVEDYHSTVGYLHFAAYCDMSRVLERLIACGWDMNGQDSNGSTALHIAARHNSKEIVRLLIQADADVNISDRDGWTPLHSSVSTKASQGIVDLLIKAGTKVDALTVSRTTPLYWAAAIGNVEVVDLLIKAGANINSVNEYGWAPLHTAASNGNIGVVELLVEAGANRKARSGNKRSGSTPLSLAKKAKNRSTVQYLKKVRKKERLAFFTQMRPLKWIKSASSIHKLSPSLS